MTAPSRHSSQEPEVSIIIPVRDGADTIGRALTSIAAQTFRDFEIIVVDDASSDDLDVALRTFRSLSVRRLVHTQQRGAAAARNSGIAAAQGRYVAFLDADDEWLPEKLERQITFLERLGGSTIACTGYTLCRADTSSQMWASADVVDCSRDLVWGCSVSPGSTLLARREILDAVGPQDERLRRLEDWDWLLRCARQCRIAILAEPLAVIHYRAPEREHGNLEATLDAIEIMRRKPFESYGIAGSAARLKFRSSLTLERAAACYRAGRTGRAILLVMRSLCLYPLRNLRFFSRMAHLSLQFLVGGRWRT